VTSKQARDTLFTYRPWANDAQDPLVAEALGLCQQDTELAKWLEHHCAVQNAIRARFNSVAAPSGLQQQIISEYRPQVVTLWWRQPAVIAAAALLTLFLAIASLWFTMPHQPPQDVSFAAYRNRMVRTAVRAYGMDLETNDMAQIRTFLAQHQAHADYVLPKNLTQAPLVGCGALSWQGKPVAMVCFRTGKPIAPGAKSDLFLFVIDQKDLADSPSAITPQFATVSRLATATWIADGKVYVLAGPDESELKQRL
jgi:hypothetical protein